MNTASGAMFSRSFSIRQFICQARPLGVEPDWAQGDARCSFDVGWFAVCPLYPCTQVEVDDWGTFRFLLLRLRGRNDKQRVLLRGRNYCSEAQLVEDINRKVRCGAPSYAAPSLKLPDALC